MREARVLVSAAFLADILSNGTSASLPDHPYRDMRITWMHFLPAMDVLCVHVESPSFDGTEESPLKLPFRRVEP